MEIVKVFVTLLVKDRQSWSDMKHAISMLIHALKIYDTSILQSTRKKKSNTGSENDGTDFADRFWIGRIRRPTLGNVVYDRIMINDSEDMMFISEWGPVCRDTV